MVSFLLNGKPRTVEGVSPTTTVLDYLRAHERLTGTKEGCAEGDCGACTIALGRVDGDGVRYEAVNSCLMMLPQLDRRAVITIEGLAAPDGALHPVQQTLVETDSTQCGFCTPGIAMSMFAFAQGGEPAEDTRIHEALAGNLCRCTGYRPIVEAFRKVAGTATRRDEPATIASLPGCEAYRDGAQTFLAPRTLDALVEARAQHPDALLLAGGTDLGLRVSKARERFPLVLSTSAVDELRRVAVGDGALQIGGGATYSDVLPSLDEHFPSFAELVRRIGSRQIRNLGTIAGNLATASPIGDTTPCLMALGASVTLRSLSGTRSLAVEDFILGYRKTALRPDEVIAAISIPLAADSQTFSAYKISKRFDQDISTVVAGFRLTIEAGIVADLRLVFGGMAAKAARASHVEAALIGKPWASQPRSVIDPLLAQDFSPISDHRGSAAYRMRVAANLIRRFQMETTGAALTRVEAL